MMPGWAERKRRKTHSGLKISGENSPIVGQVTVQNGTFENNATFGFDIENVIGAVNLVELTLWEMARAEWGMMTSLEGRSQMSHR